MCLHVCVLYVWLDVSVLYVSVHVCVCFYMFVGTFLHAFVLCMFLFCMWVNLCGCQCVCVMYFVFVCVYVITNQCCGSRSGIRIRKHPGFSTTVGPDPGFYPDPDPYIIKRKISCHFL